MYVIQWPEDFPEKGEKLAQLLFTRVWPTAEDFSKLLNTFEKSVDPNIEDRLADEAEAIELHLSDSSAAEYFGRRLSIPVMVSGKDNTLYLS